MDVSWGFNIFHPGPILQSQYVVLQESGDAPSRSVFSHFAAFCTHSSSPSWIVPLSFYLHIIQFTPPKPPFLVQIQHSPLNITFTVKASHRRPRFLFTPLIFSLIDPLFSTTTCSFFSSYTSPHRFTERSASLFLWWLYSFLWPLLFFTKASIRWVHLIHSLLPLLSLRSAPDAAPAAGAPGAPGAPGADGAPAGPPAGPPNTSSNRRLQQTQAQVEEVRLTRL